MVPLEVMLNVSKKTMQVIILILIYLFGSVQLKQSMISRVHHNTAPFWLSTVPDSDSGDTGSNGLELWSRRFPSLFDCTANEKRLLIKALKGCVTLVWTSPVEWDQLVRSRSDKISCPFRFAMTLTLSTNWASDAERKRGRRRCRVGSKIWHFIFICLQ